jgi:hypothetical protein
MYLISVIARVLQALCGDKLEAILSSAKLICHDSDRLLRLAALLKPKLSLAMTL